jgi:chromosome segregation ATPase
MAEVISSSRSAAASHVAEGLPEMSLEVGHGTARATRFVVSEAGFLIGTVPGCDLRVPGADTPSVLCLIARRPGGASIRKLAPTQPLLINGKPITKHELVNGDRITVANVELLVQLQKSAATTGTTVPAAQGAGPAALEAGRQQLLQQQEQFRQLVLRFEEDRKSFADEAQKQQQQWEQRQRSAGAPPQQQPTPAGLVERERAVAKQEEELAVQRQELAAMRQELSDIRTQLYDRYRERRDRLAGLQESVNVAARKVQERKQQLEADQRELEKSRREEEPKRLELEGQVADLRQARQRFDEDRKLHDARIAEARHEVANRVAECKQREDRLAADRAAFEKDQARFKDDLVRLDRMQAAHDAREKEIETKQRELNQRLEQLHENTREMEEQTVQLDEWHTKLSAIGEKLAKQKAEQETVSQQLGQRAAALEGQQAALASLRTRLERMREEVRQQEQTLAQQRSQQETAEAALQQKQQEVQHLREELEADRTLLDQERRMLADRGVVLDAAVSQLRQAQEKQAADDKRLREQTQALDAASAEHAEAASLLAAHITQYEELHKRLEADRESVRERNLLLTQAEQARETLQEQLRRRSEELGVRQKTLLDQQAQHEADVQALETQREEFQRQHQQVRDGLAGERQQLEQRVQQLDEREAALAAASAKLAKERQKFADAVHEFEEESAEFAQQRMQMDADRQAAEDAAQRARAEAEAARREVLALQQQVPELELRAGTALERLTHAREQMRDHLDEVHTYAGQCRDELDAMRAQLQAEADRLQQQEQGLRHSQDEQRLAVAAFRQQLIDWQGQIADMKRVMAHDESRLEQKQALVAEQARQIGADTVRLAQQTEELQQQQRVVVEKRAVMDRHLVDMREWYRRKLRELAGIKESEDVMLVDEIDAPMPKRDILSLTGDVDPIDQKLGDLMRSLGLVEADTLTALLVEARRQRRTLRQVLLASGTVTLYQMALIEAGNLDGLMLGPVRVVDRLGVMPRETVYRVFDPRRGTEALLRHLAESEAHDPVRPDEFRQRFTTALLTHPNIAATLEVLEIAGRPAVLQEWLTGLPSTDWPPLAAVPGVWYRLLLQAAQALGAAHETALLHGHLEPQHLVLTADGVLKVGGFGEPLWLTTVAALGTDAAADLLALGRLASAWCGTGNRLKGTRTKLPQPLQSILNRLLSENAAKRPASAAVLLEDLEQAGAAVPANPEAWDRLVRHIKDNAAPLATLRQSA